MATVTTTSQGFSKQLKLDLSKYEKLDALQAGHIRHIHNLVSQLDGQWNHMGGKESLQEYFDAYRYQLATMSYAIAVTHYHRLPAARSIMKPLFRRILHKMLLPDVWAYWYNTSQSGPRVDPGRTELRKPWPDPVCRENIMYSGHLLLMVSLYAMLFDDDEFEKSDSITFSWAPMFWGLGPETFHYDTRKLQDVIFAEMEQNGWLGVCCEPNMVFIVCNQYPIIAMRYNDVRNGTNKVDAVLDSYQKAWDKKGMVTSEGLYVNWIMLKQDHVVAQQVIDFTAWANAFLNSWNSAFVHSMYEKQACGFITNIDDKVRLQIPAVAGPMRRMVNEEGMSASDPGTLAKARSEASSTTVKKPPMNSLPYVLLWLSEVGRKTELDGLLRYLDDRQSFKWENGGLFYPRSDTLLDEEGTIVGISPLAGNASAAYARLNVPNGQKIMWDKPWTSQLLSSRPWLDGVELSQGVDCLRATWDEDASALIATFKTWEDKQVIVQPTARNLEEGDWAIYVDGTLTKTEKTGPSGSMTIAMEVGREEVDLVFIKAS